MNKIEVVAAIIICKDEILCMQRGNSKFAYLSYKYEFPGGKMESGEHQYPDFEIVMHSFICKSKTKDFVMKEHCGHHWLKQHDLLSLEWAQADVPIVEKLMKMNIK